MAVLTGRISFQVPKKIKVKWKAEAARLGISFSAYLRAVSERVLLEHGLEQAIARLGLDPREQP